MSSTSIHKPILKSSVPKLPLAAMARLPPLVAMLATPLLVVETAPLTARPPPTSLSVNARSVIASAARFCIRGASPKHMRSISWGRS